MHSELPAPDVLWGRTLVVQVVQDPDCSGQLGELCGGRVTFDMGYQDNWFTLIRYHEDKAVLFGRGRDDTYVAPRDPQDLLAGAPPWVPVAELVPLVLREEIDFVRWWDGKWGHAEQLERLRIDYETSVALYPLLEFDQLVSVFAESLPGATHSEMAALLRAAADASVTPHMVRGLDATLASAITGYLTLGGVVSGTTRVEEPLPAADTGPRRRRRLTIVQHHRDLVAAMVDAVEMPRPQPPRTPELDDILARIESLHQDYGHVEFAFRVGRGIGVGAPRHARKIPTGLRRLRDVERGESGRWLFIRFVVARDEIRVERAYDHWPHWYPRNPYYNDPDRHDLLDEFATRPAAAVPAWAEVAEDAYAQVTE